MKVDNESLKNVYQDAFDKETVLFVMENGEVFENWNIEGLLASGSLDKPHLRFNLHLLRTEITQYAEYKHSYKGMEAVNECINQESCEVFEQIQSIISSWDGGTICAYDASHLRP